MISRCRATKYLNEPVLAVKEDASLAFWMPAADVAENRRTYCGTGKTERLSGVSRFQRHRGRGMSIGPHREARRANWRVKIPGRSLTVLYCYDRCRDDGCGVRDERHTLHGDEKKPPRAGA